MLSKIISDSFFFKKAFLIFSVVTLFSLMNSKCIAKDIGYTVLVRPDGGYTLTITKSKRHWKPITAEGIFPKETKNYTIDIIGKGEDWSNRNQHGYYYASEAIKCNRKAWDFGYAWVDNKRKYLYLNLYWASSPDDNTSSDVNGKYLLNP